MLTFLRNTFCNRNRYREHDEAVIISCFFNPQNSPYRLKAFNKFYDSIKHMNHLILECVIGEAKPQLPENENIQRVYTENLLWHKESLLNLAVSKLPAKYKYIFWVDADVIFTNLNWLRDSVVEFKAGAAILQPFEYCVHLDRDEVEPKFNYEENKKYASIPVANQRMWRSFCANYVDSHNNCESNNYDVHGHVGFAWGATRELLERVPLYDKALIGGADHIIAHAAAGQIPHSCINKSFTEDLDAVYDWSKRFYAEAQGKIAYTKGDLFHLWHGDIEKRQYLKRIKEFTPTTKKIVQKDSNGLYVTKSGDDAYIKKYFNEREVRSTDDGFMNSMAIAYMTDSPALGMVVGGNPTGAMVGGMFKDNTKHHNDAGSHSHTNTTTKGEANASENFS